MGLSDGAERVCLHHLSPGGHHIHTPRTDACAGETLVLVRSLTPLPPPPPPPVLPPCSVCSALLSPPLMLLILMLMMLMMLLSLAQTRGGNRVAPLRQDWVGYIPALMPGPYGWHVIGKSHHMRAGD